MTKRKPENKKYSAHKFYNKQFFIFPLLSAVLLFSSILCALTDDGDIALFAGVLSALIAVGIFVIPISFVFDSKKLTVHYWLWHKTIFYNDITSVVEFKFFESFMNLPKYEIMFAVNYKGQITIKDIELPKNKNIKKMIESHLRGKLVR